MKHKIKMHILTPEEQAELNRLKQEAIGHRPEDYSNFDEYFRNEVVIPIEKFFEKNY